MFDGHSTVSRSGSVRPGWSFWRCFAHRRWGESVFFSIIFIAGFVVFLIQLWTWAIPQLTLYQEFIPSYGTVLETRIAETTVDDSTVFRPEVLLEHQVQGVSYQVWTFDLQTLKPKEGFVADRRLAEVALLPFSIGKQITCWYRNNYPEQAVVLWKNPVWGWFFLLLSFSLIVLGIVGFAQSFRLVAVSNERRAAMLSAAVTSPLNTLIDSSHRLGYPMVPDIRIINESPGTHLAFRLPLGNLPIFPLAGLTFFTLVWNIIAWGVLFHSFLNPLNDWSVDQIIGIGLRSLFFGVGIILMIGVAHRLFQTFRLGPMLFEISDHPLYPGRKYRVLLRQPGNLRFYRLAIDIVCEEVARFRQGTDTVTNRRDVFRQTLFSRDDFETTPDLPLHQEFFFQLPIEAMHSFRCENNEVVWKMDIFTQITSWSPINRECPVIVRPVVISDLMLEGVGL